MSHRAALALPLAVAIVLAGCSDDPESADEEAASEAPAAVEPVTPELAELAEGSTSVAAGASATELALSTSQSVFTSAPVVVLAPVDDVAAQARAASIAVQLGVPMLLSDGAPLSEPAASDGSDPSATAPSPGSAIPSTAPAAVDAELATAVERELERLGTSTVVDVGGVTAGLALTDAVAVVPAPADADFESVLGVAPGASQPTSAAELVAAVAALEPGAAALLQVTDAPDAPDAPDATPESGSETPPALPPVEPAEPIDDVLVLTTPDAAWVAATATARAAGARVHVATGADPRADSAAVAALGSSPATTVLAVGDAFGAPETVRYRVDVAATGVELPGGGQVLFPGRTMVALYGNPTTGALGVLGEQPLEAAITRAQQTAAEYDGLWGDEPVVPTFEIIATVASASAGPDNNYSTEMTIDELRPYVDAAADAGVYVVLDLQPGRTDFLTQAKIYEELLKEPHVGLALDPEWRLEPGQVHLRQIGSVGVDEVNSVGTWLADLTRANMLPQKLLLLHQFRLDMIEGRERLDTSRDELSYLIHADGNGAPGAKYATYGVMTESPPPNVWWGWKNFYDEDTPTFTPAETVAVDPSPVFVSYQ